MEKAASFSFIVIPDTQKMSRYHPHVFHRMAGWIAKRAGELNIQAVLHLGDVVDQGARDEEEYRIASSAMSMLYDTGLPVLIAPGNHDYDVPIVSSSGSLSRHRCRELSMFNQYFGVHRYEQAPWFGEVYEQGKAENMYALIESGEASIMILVLEFMPRGDVMAWADKMIRKHQDRHVFIITHSYMYMNGERVGPGIKANPKQKYEALSEGHDGEDMWQKHLRHHPNVVAVFSGHHIPECVSHRVDEGIHGNMVYQLFQNWQEQEYGGSGRFRMVHYDASSRNMSVSVFNPLSEQVEEEAGYTIHFRDGCT